MGTAMLAAMMGADVVAATASGGVRTLPQRPPIIAALPLAEVGSLPVHRCGDGVPGAYEADAQAAIDGACNRLIVSTHVPRPTVSSARFLGGEGRGDSGGWRIARAVLPGLQGLVGPGGLGLGIGSELRFVRGARMSLHLAPARDTRIAATTFAPETTVMARCSACWTESEAAGAGIDGDRRSPSSAAAGRVSRVSSAARAPSSAGRAPTP